MSTDQFRRFRQVGTYGAYRVVLRNVPGLTMGDGWTPDTTARALAELVNDSMPGEVRLHDELFQSGTKWGSWSDGGEARYWVERGWQASRAKCGGWLPTAEEAVGQRLPVSERRLLEPTLFAADSPRRVTAEVLAHAKRATSHADLCDTLAASSALGKKAAPTSIASLPSFSRFADAAMHAMRGLWNEINQDGVEQAPAVEQLARSAELRTRLDLMRGAGAAWLRAPGRSTFPHAEAATRLAKAMQDAAQPIEQLRALSHHHQEYGGSRRWFREQAGRMVPLVADTGIAASDYRFRLRPLVRLAAQCGVADMSNALVAVERKEVNGETLGGVDDDENSADDDDVEGDSL